MQAFDSKANLLVTNTAFDSSAHPLYGEYHRSCIWCCSESGILVVDFVIQRRPTGIAQAESKRGAPDQPDSEPSDAWWDEQILKQQAETPMMGKAAKEIGEK